MEIPTVQKSCIFLDVKWGVIAQSILDVLLFLCLITLQSQIRPINAFLIVFYAVNVVVHVLILFAVIKKPIRNIILVGVLWNGFKILALACVPIIYRFTMDDFIREAQAIIFWYFFVAVEFYFWIVLYSFHKGSTVTVAGVTVQVQQ